MIKELDISLGRVGGLVLGDPIVGQQLTASGYYYDPITGQKYYYDANQNQWYSVSAAGLFYPLVAALSYMSPAPKQVSLAPGEKLKITLSFKYIGPAISGVSTRYVIGVYGALGFTEKVYLQSTLNIPTNTTATPITVTQDATLTLPASGAGADWDDIYVKMWTSTWEYFFGYENALIIVGLQPTITEFKILDFSKVTG